MFGTQQKKCEKNEKKQKYKFAFRAHAVMDRRTTVALKDFIGDIKQPFLHSTGTEKSSKSHPSILAAIQLTDRPAGAVRRSGRPAKLASVCLPLRAVTNLNIFSCLFFQVFPTLFCSRLGFNPLGFSLVASRPPPPPPPPPHQRQRHCR